MVLKKDSIDVQLASNLEQRVQPRRVRKVRWRDRKLAPIALPVRDGSDCENPYTVCLASSDALRAGLCPFAK